VYTGARFDAYFDDFRTRYGFEDMYSGGFYPYRTKEEFWAYWSRYIWINRYAPIPSDLYGRLLDAVREKDYFVITTNVDHCFQRAGFDKKRLFYTQGDYGLFQSSRPQGASAHKTYGNEECIRKMVVAQGFEVGAQNELVVPADVTLKMAVPTELLPICPDDGEPMTTNLRADDAFVEDEGWHLAAERYADFLRTRGGAVLFLELGVGFNTPAIIKYPFWSMTARNPEAVYACINFGEAVCPEELKGRSICIDGDIARVVEDVIAH